MKTVAIILAGGSGKRMGIDIPKQFISVFDKPILIYTLEAFQSHPLVDEIEVVCKDGWKDVLLAYAKEYKIDKMKYVTTGGETGQESIRNGVFNLEGQLTGGDIVIIHDGIRPILDKDVLTDVIKTAKEFGSAATSMPYNEQIFVKNENDETKTSKYIPRETLRRVSTPQAYEFEALDGAYHEAFEKEIGIYGSSYTNTMWVDLGNELHLASGSEKNIKLTTKEDLEIFKALLKNNKG